MKIAGASLALILTAASPAPEPDPPPAPEVTAPETIQGDAERDLRMTIPVHIGGKGPYDFVVDTGSQRSLVATSVAVRLALPPSGQLRIMDLGGLEILETVQAAEIGIGSRSYRDLVLPVVPDRHLGAAGVIGTDNLQHQRIVFDFAQNRMAVGDAGQVGGDAGYEIVVNARSKSGQLIIADATVDGLRVAVLIDTGASSSIGNRALQRALSHRGAPDQATLVSVTGNEIPAQIGMPKQLVIDRIAISGLVVAYADSPVFPALGLDKRPALMLGMRELRMFRRVAIDFGSRKVMFDLPPELSQVVPPSR
ncbi:MAG: retroviral-like aspartic protease family protein [Novosphingobium sp.]